MPLQITEVADPSASNNSVAGGNPAGSGTVAGGAQAITNLPGVSPPPVGVSAVEIMPAVAKAGLRLSYFVLSIVTGAIVLLVVYLLWMGSVVGDDVRDAYMHVVSPTRIGSEFYTLGRLEEFELDLKSAKADPNWTMSASSSQNADSVMAFLNKLPSVTSEQYSDLCHCNPLPVGSSRIAVTSKCEQILDSIRQSALEAASSTNNAQVASEEVDKILVHRQAFLSFWLQAAQLILLNLLLPLLTALFGYIFGTQQAQRIDH